MYKIFISTLIMMIFLSGCAPTGLIAPVDDHSQAIADQSYSYTWDMQIPEIKSVDNLMMMQDGYYEKKPLTYTITKENVQELSYCPASEKTVRFVAYRYPTLTTGDYDDGLVVLGEFNRDEIVEGRKIPLELLYEGEWLGLQFSPAQLKTLAKEGFLVMEPNSRLLEYLQKNASYTYTDQESSTPEWSLYYGLVGGKSDPTQRYPYNSVYVTTDLLLHTYHKLFANSLKYYEMKTARSQVADIALESMQHFAQLAKKASSDARAYYDYLTAYWSVAHIFLPSEEEYKTRYDALQQQYWNSRGEQSQDFEDNDFTDHYLHQWIRERLEWTLKEYPTQYNDAVEKLVEEILAGKEERGRDHLAHAFSPQTDPKFVIVQDYTMFVPRGHYADNTLLKTYFFAMKWLMRHKMYARDPHMAKASLLLASHLPEKSSSQLKHLQTFVKTMIGADDDVTLEDLQKFLTTRSLKTPQAILNASTDGRAQDIAALRPQKIISTPYETVENSQVSEQEAKEMTAGFVFFGEKFAVDSWIADQLTAGPSEQESEYKPPVVSVYQLFDTLLTTDHWKSYAQHWLSSVQKQFKLTDTHLSSYPQVRDETKQEMSGVLEHDPKTLYTKRLEVMETTTVVPDRAPIYMRGVNYLKKIFNTMLGTYTELKHDTILYVKQAFAELGAGGGAECDVLVEYDELPVPKWYVEPQFATIDALRELSQSTHEFFGEVNKHNFRLFHEYLDLIKMIALKQANNEVISDEDFETMRLAWDQLGSIMSVIHDGGELGTRSAVIADIFTSAVWGPYYIATGRPLLMVVLVDDVNGKRAVIGPVYSTYEFYGTPVPMSAGRYTDQDWRMGYDALKDKYSFMTAPLQQLISY